MNNLVTTIKCGNCGKTFEDYKSNHRKFCSHRCYSESKHGGVPWNKGTKGVMRAWNRGLKGYLRGREITWADKISQGKKNSLKSTLASKKTAKRMADSNGVGAEHPAWKGGKSFEPYAVDWTKTLRRSIRERDKYTCWICKKPQEELVYPVHHIDYNKKNCDPENLITLCNSCHTKTNYDRDYWIDYFKKLND